MLRFDVTEYARRGAVLRGKELQADLAEIFRAFPDLRRAGRGLSGKAGAPEDVIRSAEGRQGEGEEYWAARRKAKNPSENLL